jgi:hypothetical protein
MSFTAIELITAIGAVATPVLLAIFSVIGWQLRRKVERRIELENQLREDRIAIYNDIIEPFVILLMADAAWAQDKKNMGKNKGNVATQKMLSLEYRRRGFQMSLMGSDEVVRSYNELLQYFYDRAEEPSNPSSDVLVEMLELLGNFLLEIRRSMGNEDTKLEAWDMIEWWMADARKLRGGAS